MGYIQRMRHIREERTKENGIAEKIYKDSATFQRNVLRKKRNADTGGKNSRF